MLDGRTASQALQSRDLVALRCHHLLQLRYGAQQFYKPSFQLGTRQTGQIGGWRHAKTESYATAPGQAQMSEIPQLLPRLPLTFPNRDADRTRFGFLAVSLFTICSFLWKSDAEGAWSKPQQQPPSSTT